MLLGSIFCPSESSLKVKRPWCFQAIFRKETVVCFTAEKCFFSFQSRDFALEIPDYSFFQDLSYLKIMLVDLTCPTALCCAKSALTMFAKTFAGFLYLLAIDESSVSFDIRM